LAGKAGRLLAAAAVAWSALSAESTIKVEVSMKAHVELKVQGEAGVRVGPGLGKADPRKQRCDQRWNALRLGRHA
jgi:hypothetical protein